MDNNGGERRTLLLTVLYGLWGLIGSALSIPAAVYLLFPPKLRKGTEWADAGDIAKLEPNTPLEMVFRHNRTDGWKVFSEKSTAWVVKLADNKVVALGPQCTHLGCAYHWEDQKKEFLCPCHTSTFSIEGKVLTGPAPRPLDRYETKIEGNKLMLGAIHEAGEPTE
ncbi:MAG: ubiquinol-cytochrome c reductase iron-sulfur subunit [Bryobacteraceae bacterium]